MSENYWKPFVHYLQLINPCSHVQDGLQSCLRGLRSVFSQGLCERISAQELIQLLLLPVECLVGTVGTLLLENPLGQNGLTHQGLLYEAAKVFGLRGRKLKLFLNETQTQGKGLWGRKLIYFYRIKTRY